MKQCMCMCQHGQVSKKSLCDSLKCPSWEIAIFNQECKMCIKCKNCIYVQAFLSRECSVVFCIDTS